MKSVLAVLAAASLAASVQAQSPQAFPFVLPWDDASTTIASMAALNAKPAGADGFVRSGGGHLVTNTGRLRLLGVNICMDAAFPEREVAERVAARMAKFGINAVRFHHMDGWAAPRGLLQADMRTIDPGQLDRLDYFIAQLKQNGIYVDLNLHVSRLYPGLPAWESMPSFFKGVDNFQPDMIRLQKEYARALLTHLNPYTKTRYIAEPAVAFIEINNENGVIQEWGNGALDTMPQAYQAELTRQWNAWLKTRYADAGALRRAWDAADVPLGAEMLKADPKAWSAEQHGAAKAIFEAGAFGPQGGPAERISVTQAGDEAWHVQWNQPGLSLQAGKPYTLTFWARANAAATIGVNAMQAHDPWADLWADSVDLGPAWREYSFVFRPSRAEVNARIGFGEMGSRTGVYEFAGVSLRPGGSSAALRNAAPGSVSWFPHRGFSALPPAARADWVRFLWDTETAYWAGMRGFLRNDLKAKALIIGSQVTNSPEPVQATMDVVDNHAYWKHPAFPRRPWDAEDWTVENVAMAGAAKGGTLPGLAWRRAAGKPYVVTEYNHPAPNSYGSEMMPLICAYAALQDWDGVFAFDYNSNNALYKEGRIGGFFSIGNHPAKMATMPAAAAMFRRSDVSPARTEALRPLTAASSQSAISSRAGYIAWGAPDGVDPMEALRHRCGWSASAKPLPLAAPASSPVTSDTGQLSWGDAVTVNAPRTKAAIGVLRPQGVSLDGVRISGPGQWAVVTLTLVSGKSFSGPARILVTAVAGARNTGMVWKDEKRNSVGAKWGTAPSVAEGVNAVLRLPVPASRLKAWALDETGRRAHALPIAPDGSVVLGPEHKTLWYEVEVVSHQ
ncbi:MAG TPA: carbohydrate binding domain-containing protein [Armatimonadota bacterium]|jgi:hypothetical protein